jgi:hypothetical protein
MAERIWTRPPDAASQVLIRVPEHQFAVVGDGGQALAVRREGNRAGFLRAMPTENLTSRAEGLDRSIRGQLFTTPRRALACPGPRTSLLSSPPRPHATTGSARKSHGDERSFTLGPRNLVPCAECEWNAIHDHLSCMRAAELVAPMSPSQAAVRAQRTRSIRWRPFTMSFTRSVVAHRLSGRFGVFCFSQVN